MIKTILTLTTILTLSVTAHARLGDSPFWATIRYAPNGAPKPKDDTKRLSFHKDGIHIQCSFTGGKCTKITFRNTVKWKDREIETYLYNNTQAKKWTEVKARAGREWRREDGGKATLNHTTLTFTSPDHV